jgi:hypothetical protein
MYLRTRTVSNLDDDDAATTTLLLLLLHALLLTHLLLLSMFERVALLPVHGCTPNQHRRGPRGRISMPGNSTKKCSIVCVIHKYRPDPARYPQDS